MGVCGGESGLILSRSHAATRWLRPLKGRFRRAGAPLAGLAPARSVACRSRACAATRPVRNAARFRFARSRLSRARSARCSTSPDPVQVPRQHRQPHHALEAVRAPRSHPPQAALLQVVDRRFHRRVRPPRRAERRRPLPLPVRLGQTALPLQRRATPVVRTAPLSRA